MKLRKKFLQYGSLMTAALVLSACGTDAEGQTAGTAESTGPVEIEFWYGLGSVAGETMEEIITDFNESQDEVEVTGVQQANYSETFQKVQASIAADNAPAVFITEPGVVNTYGPNGTLASLDSFIEADADFKPDDFLEVFSSLGNVEGKTYGIPAYGTTQVMYYNQDVYEEAGIDPEEAFATWESLAAASEKIVSSGAAEFGHLPMWGSGNLVDIALSNGGTILNEDGTEVMIDSQEWIDAWEFVRTQVAEEQNMDIISGGQGWEYWYKTIDQVMTGNAGGYTGSSGDKGDLDFSYIGSAVQPGLNGNDAAPAAGALYMAVPASTTETEQEAAFEWMSYFTSPEVSSKWSQTIGYIPVRKSTMEVEEYAQFIEENPHAAVPYEQAMTASPAFIDPTGGKISDALSIAADKVELENIPAEQALKEAKETAQAALDEVNNQ